MTTKSDLLADIQRGWEALNAALQRLSEGQMTTLRDAQGWTVKDHLVHLARWERSVVFLLQGMPRHAGLGVDETIYLTESYEEINAAIYQQSKDLTMGEAFAQLHAVHQQLLDLLHPLTDADLLLPYRHYLPNEPGEGDGPPAYQMIYGNSAGHFSEHLDWIEALVERQ